MEPHNSSSDPCNALVPSGVRYALSELSPQTLSAIFRSASYQCQVDSLQRCIVALGGYRVAVVAEPALSVLRLWVLLVAQGHPDAIAAFCHRFNHDILVCSAVVRDDPYRDGRTVVVIHHEHLILRGARLTPDDVEEILFRFIGVVQSGGAHADAGDVIWDG